jgi:hypothetical protein
MMILQNYTITLLPGETKLLCLPVYCMNVELDAPDPEYSYVIGNPTTRACLQEILSLLEGKNIRSRDAMSIQSMLWNCLEGVALTSDNRAFLRNL